MSNDTIRSSHSHPHRQRPRIERIEGAVMPVNSYVVDGPDGLVVVDGQLTVSDARAVRSLIDRWDRPVAALLVTHPHPDHYAGAATILDGLGAPIVTTAEVAAVIARDDAEKDTIVGPMMGNEWPSERRFPDQIVADGETVSLGGLQFDVQALGPGESHADVLFTLDERFVFCGDIAYHDVHAYLLDCHHEQWLYVLDRLARELPGDAELHVGHGAPAGIEVLAAQATYVRAFVDAVGAHLDADPQQRHDAVVAHMRQYVADERLEFLMELSIEPMRSVLWERDRSDAEHGLEASA